MKTLYAEIKVAPNASAEEIQLAIDRLYNESRHKVTSHDPAIAAQANQEILLLEKIRSTLLDPEKRLAYDESLRKFESPGGLIDPEAKLSPGSSPLPYAMPSVPMQAGQSSQPSQSQSIGHSNVWNCPKCQHDNPIGTQFCEIDGVRLGFACPSCKVVVELKKEYCPSCGVNKIEFFNNTKQETSNKLLEKIKHIDQKMTSISKVSAISSAKDLSPIDQKTFNDLREGKPNGCVIFLLAYLGFIIGFTCYAPVWAMISDDSVLSFIIFLLIPIVSFVGVTVTALLVYRRMINQNARVKAQKLLSQYDKEKNEILIEIERISAMGYPPD